jgi:Domain of unknown function (DUF1883)
MSDHLHSRLFLKEGDVVEVNSDTQANVILTTDSDYSDYKAGRSYQYYGGFFTHFPARLAPPYSGYWNVILDLGGGQANVRHSIRVISLG